MTVAPMLKQIEKHLEFAVRAEGFSHRFNPTIVQRVAAEHRARADELRRQLQEQLPEMQIDLIHALAVQQAATAALRDARERALRVVIGELIGVDPEETLYAETRLKAASRAVVVLESALKTLTPITCNEITCNEGGDRQAILVVDDEALYPLTSERVQIGRARNNTIQLAADNLISRRHCALTREEGAWCISDLDSANGTWIGGNLITEHRRLIGGEMILIGGTSLRFEWVDDTQVP